MSLVVRAPAKINWTLRVLGRRDDGYHEIESLVSAVSLFDDLVFSPRIDARFVLTCEDPSLPTDERNLICQAAALAMKEATAPVGLDCRLTKRIPIGGGLGGGSSDGAAALRALNQLWSLQWSTERLMAEAGRLGSDVPFFVPGSTAVISGRGEQVRPMTLPWRGWIVLLLPGFSVSTAEVYRAWRPAGEATDSRGAVPVPSASEGVHPSQVSGEETHCLRSGLVHGPGATSTCPAPDAEMALSAVKWMEMAYNMLEEPAMAVCPALREIAGRATQVVGRPVRISGSGSSLFTAFDSAAEAQRAADRLGWKLQLRTEVVQPVEGT